MKATISESMGLNVCWREFILSAYLVDTVGNLDSTRLCMNLSESGHEGVVPDTKFIIDDGILCTSFHMNLGVRHNLVAGVRSVLHSRE